MATRFMIPARCRLARKPARSAPPKRTRAANRNLFPPGTGVRRRSQEKSISKFSNGRRMENLRLPGFRSVQRHRKGQERQTEIYSRLGLACDDEARKNLSRNFQMAGGWKI